MPVVYPEPTPQRKWYEHVGAIQGKTADMLLRAVLASQGGGGGMFQSRDIPNPVYQPSGGSSPSPSGVPSSGATPSPTSPYGTRPFLNQRELENLSKIQSMQQAQAQAEWYKRLPGMSGTMNPLTGQPEVTPQASSSASGGFSTERLQQIANEADAGNAQAKAFMDYYLGSQ